MQGYPRKAILAKQGKPTRESAIFMRPAQNPDMTSMRMATDER